MTGQRNRGGGVTPRRQALYRAIGQARRDLAIADADYRAWLEGRFGKTSGKDLTVAELEAVRDHMKEKGWKGPRRKRKAQARGHDAWHHRGEGKMARALWIALYNLGLVKDRADEALAAFICRQTKVEHPNWVRDWKPVNEALKAIAAREGGVDWSGYRVYRGRDDFTTVYSPTRRVIEAQWRMLADARIVHANALDDYALAVVGEPARQSLANFTDARLREVMAALGVKLRRAIQEGRVARPAPPRQSRNQDEE